MRPLRPNGKRKGETPQTRFWSKVVKSGRDDCWPWNAYLMPSGYGRITVDGKEWLAHRYSYTLHHGDIPVGLSIDHACRERACVNPKHLRLATQKQNMENYSSSRANVPRGVNWAKDAKKWRAYTTHNGKYLHLGYFEDCEAAGEAARQKRLELYTHNEMDRLPC